MSLLSESFRTSLREGFLFAPDIICHEVSNAICKATRREDRHLSLELGEQAIHAFLSWGIGLERSDTLISYAYALAIRYNCTYYDALYLASAEMNRTYVVYADGKLKRTLGNRFHFALWIEDYPDFADSLFAT